MGKLLSDTENRIQDQYSISFEVHITGPRSWHTQNLTYTTGCAFLGDQYLSGDCLARLISKISSVHELQPTLEQLNGFFALVHQIDDNELIAATDHARSIPLFYCLQNNKFYLSNDAYWIERQIGPMPPDKDIAIEYALTGYVTGSNTLHPMIMQLRSGELLHYATHHCKQPKLTTYYKYTRNPISSLNFDDHIERMNTALLESCQRLIKVADGRLIVVPLSGGLDSTRIAVLLRQLKYDKVLTYTYGRPGNYESNISRVIADQLGYKWHFIPYTEVLWREWYASTDCQEYCRLASGLNTVPILQEWPAVMKMNRAKILPSDSLFVPGYSGEAFYGAPFMPDNWPPFQENGLQVGPTVQAILDLHYILPTYFNRTRDVETRMLERIVETIGQCDDHLSSASIYENWIINERQAKFITNAVRAFEFWGYDWWLPLWDRALADFWRVPPLCIRRGRRISRAYVRQVYKEVTGCDYPVSTTGSKHSWKSAAVHAAQYLAARVPLCKMLYRMIDGEIKYKHPLAWYGIVPRHIFRQLFQPGASINSFLALAQLGQIDLTH